MLRILKDTKEQENESIIIDIYHNADRCLFRDSYADCLARTWRLIEGIVFFYVRTRYEIEPRNLKQSKESGKNILRKYVPKWLTQEKKYQSFWDIYKKLLIEKIKDLGICEFVKKEFEWESNQKLTVYDMTSNLRLKRNDSIVAHGVVPVDLYTAKNSLSLAKKYIQFVFPDTDLDEYPFTKEKLKNIGDGLMDVIK